MREVVFGWSGRDQGNIKKQDLTPFHRFWKTIDRDFYETVIHPFFANYFREEFEEAAGDYSKLYRKERPAGRTRADEIYSGGFVNAFNAEFGLTPDEAIGKKEL